MGKKKFTLDANNFSNIGEFYTEIQKTLTDDSFNIGRNLDALVDVLRGGFVKYELGEEITIVWKNFEKSKKDFNSTPNILNSILEIFEEAETVELIKE